MTAVNGHVTAGGSNVDVNLCDVWLSVKSESGVGSLLIFTYREHECIQAKVTKPVVQCENRFPIVVDIRIPVNSCLLKLR
jgi:hypothetical protein